MWCLFLIRALQRQKQMDISVRSRPARSTEQVPGQRDPVFKKTNINTEYMLCTPSLTSPAMLTACANTGCRKISLSAGTAKQQPVLLEDAVGGRESELWPQYRSFPPEISLCSLAVSSIQKYSCPAFKATGSRLASQSAWLGCSGTGSSFPGFSQKEPV